MQDGSWSWVKAFDETFPKMTGKPHFTPDKRTCVLPGSLDPGKAYVIWLNHPPSQHFQNQNGHQPLRTFSSSRRAAEPKIACTETPPQGRKLRRRLRLSHDGGPPQNSGALMAAKSSRELIHEVLSCLHFHSFRCFSRNGFCIFPGHPDTR